MTLDIPMFYFVLFFAGLSHFLQVRGTFGSGKTTLAVLLGHYILEQEPNEHVILLTCGQLRT